MQLKLSKELISINRNFIMGCAMLSIMLFHQHFVNIHPFIEFQIFGLMGVDIFLFVSGFGIAYSIKKHDLLDFYKRRFIRILPTCLFRGIILSLLFIIFNFGSFHPLKIISFDQWYIQTILLFYIISPFLYKIILRNQTNLILGIIIICLLLSFIPNQRGFSPYDLIRFLTWSASRLPVYILGMIISMKEITIKKQFLLIGLFPLCAMFIYRYLFVVKHLCSINYYLWSYIILLATGMPTLIYLIIKIGHYLNLKLYSFIELFGKYSLEIYLWHGIIYSFINWS